MYSTQGDGAVSLAGYKRNLLLKLNNLQGTSVKSYKIFRAWVSEYTAFAELDANANSTLIESLVLTHEGWERDVDVVEPTET